MNYRYLILAMTVWVLSSIQPIEVKAQEVETTPSISNLVLDPYNNPVPGVNVTVKGSDKTAITSEDGKFVLDYAIGDVLKFSREGFLYYESKITNKDLQKGVLVHLHENFIKNLPVVPGPYGKDIEKNDYLGSASTVYTDQLTTTMGTTIIPALTGRVTGLNIVQKSGARSHYSAPNYSVEIGGLVPVFGRGIYSDNSEFSVSSRGVSPIVIVDGVQREFYALDPEAVESVSLQKDALSSMFLGMQSSRGALIITTKRPTQNALNVSFTAKLGVNSPLKTPKALDSYQYAYMLNEALTNDGKLPIYSSDDFNKFRSGSNLYTHPNVDWYNELFNDNAISQSYNVTVSGGDKTAQYFVSLGYMGEEGLFKTSSINSYNTNLNYQRYLISSKVNINVTTDFRAELMLIGRIEDGNQPGGIEQGGYSDLLTAAFITPNGAYPIKNPNGSWGGNISFDNNLMAQTINSGYLRDNARDVLGTINLNYDFDKQVKGLSVQAIGSITTQTRTLTDRSKGSSIFNYKLDDYGSALYTQYREPTSQVNKFYSIGNYQDLYGQLAINYNRKFGNHGLKASLKGDTRTLINNYDLPEIPSNIMGDVSYSFADKYFVQAALTESYYNRYAPDHRWGTFYAFGLGWDMSKENFMKDAEWLNQLKIRTVYGKTGNGITNSGYYTWSQTYSTNLANSYPMGSSQTRGNYTDENMPLANANIVWEKAHKTNVGIDFSVLNKRLQFTADYYNDYYYDLLQPRGKSIGLIGAEYPYENIGELRRYGTELTLTYQDRIGKFNYYVSANWNYDQSKILFLDEQELPHDYLYSTGKPLSAYWGLVADGFLTAEDIATGYPVMAGFKNIQPGDVKYVDKNEDGVIDEFDTTVIGGDKPLSFFGLDLGFEYRGFEFSMLWQGTYNRDIYLNNRNFTEGFQSIKQHYGQAYEHLLNRWTPETASTATFPRLSAGGNNYNNGNNWGSSLWIRSGNYIRLKNLHVAYSLPQSICRNYLGNLRVKFFVDGQNLLTMAACDLVDPEVNFTNYPIQRNVNFGINIKF